MRDRVELPVVLHVLGGRGGIGGAERVLAEIASGVRSFRHEILVPFSTSGGVTELSHILGQHRVRAFGAASMAGLLPARAWVRRQIRRVSPTIVHAHLFHAAVLVASLPRRALPATVLTHHHGSWLPDQGRRLETALDRWAGRRYDRVVAVSDAVARFLEDAYGYPNELVEVIHNGWSGEPRPRWPKIGPDFLCVGHLRWEKGHDVLLRAFAAVVDEEPHVRLRIVGEGRLRRQLEHLATELGIASAVEFAGAVSDVWSEYAAAGISVVPSRTEPQGIVVLEAMAAGCPLIASNVGGIPEMVQDGRTARLVPPGDAAALADAMLELHRSSHLRSAFATAARREAADWPMQATVDRYAALYHRLG